MSATQPVPEPCIGRDDVFRILRHEVEEIERLLGNQMNRAQANYLDGVHAAVGNIAASLAPHFKITREHAYQLAGLR